MFLGVPLTSKIKTGFYYFDLTEAGIKSSVILSQVRLMSSKRLLRRMDLFRQKFCSSKRKIERNNLKLNGSDSRSLELPYGKPFIHQV